MTGPVAIDTPDYQRGVVSAQKLVGTGAAYTTTLTVGVPPNTETLVVVAPQVTLRQQIVVSGVVSGVVYPYAILWTPNFARQYQTWWVDVSQAVDEQVEVNIEAAPTAPWYVYADSGVHLVADMGGPRSSEGMPFVTPSAPDGGPDDHPLNELNVGGGLITTNGTVVVAPGAGKRLRLFALNLGDNGSSSDTVIAAAGGNPVYFAITAPGNGALALPLTGMPMPANTALDVASTSSSRAVYAIAYYTVELV